MTAFLHDLKSILKLNLQQQLFSYHSSIPYSSSKVVELGGQDEFLMIMLHLNQHFI